ncbi:MAG: hypothetical protein IGS38_12890, partial [Synechococcales cyanobacterium M58_A2018_015]|nr:hypothetical protein [Synechococcales cyanobacterium M58_A2018_015]
RTESHLPPASIGHFILEIDSDEFRPSGRLYPLQGLPVIPPESER